MVPRAAINAIRLETSLLMQVNRVSYQNNVFIGMFIYYPGEKGEGEGGGGLNRRDLSGPVLRRVISSELLVGFSKYQHYHNNNNIYLYPKKKYR